MVFIESRAFTRRLAELAGESVHDVLQAVQSDLLREPLRGVLVRGLGGIRKARASNPARGKGKRGGYRYLYLYLAGPQHIHLLFILDKDEQEDLTPQERRVLREMVAQLESSEESEK